MNLSELSIHAWIQQHGIKNESGTPLDFRDHLFLFDIYADNSPKLVCYKAAQVGFSTMAILKSLWLAKMKHVDIIYTMPSSSDMKDFVGGKVNRLIMQNPVLLDYVKDKDSIEQKQVGDNIIYYRGTWTEKSAIAVSSDLNVHDEEDRSKQDVIQMYGIASATLQSKVGVALLKILLWKEMELVDTGRAPIKSTGLFVALDVYANNFLTGQKILIPLDDALYASIAGKSLLERNGVSVGGYASSRTANIRAIGYLSSWLRGLRQQK
jgi:hypothetical protein